jgi:RNA polymerase sigma-70 factor (ECF subfamily)
MTRSETEALEIAQETFLSVSLHLGQFRNEKDFSAWLHRTAASHALLRLGRGGRAPVADEKLEEELRVSKFHPTGVLEHSPRPDWSSNAYQPLLSAKLRRAIEDAVDDLPQSHRQVLLLKDVAGLSYEEIAHVTAQSIPAIKDGVHRARLSLRETIDCFCRES